MDLTTLIGLFCGLAVVAWGIMARDISYIKYFIHYPSMLVVFGGSFFATMVSYPTDTIMGLLKVLKNAFIVRRQDPRDMISVLVEFAKKARREGILSLENSLDEVADPFFKSGIRLAVDGVEPDLVKDILDTELAFIEERHKAGQAVMVSLGTYSPAFGLIGTLMGLIIMLVNMDDPKKIGDAMALALVTTFYGSLAGNLIFLPLAGKLKARSEEEILLKELTIEGIMAIQTGDNPRIVEQKLMVFLPPDKRVGLSF